MNYYNIDTPYDREKIKSIELLIYNELLIPFYVVPEPINMTNIFERDPLSYIDRDFNFPQHLFFINKYKGKTLFGRKIISQLYIENKINALHCSMINASMLLGFLHKRKKRERKITIEYYPLTNGEKMYVFNEIKKRKDIDIYYPYKYYDYFNRKEKNSPENGWKFNIQRKIYLSNGEKHFRKFTELFFNNYHQSIKVLYDPACSSGEFLYEFKKIFPFVYTIGHDISNEMIDYAHEFIDESLCCDALNSPIADASIDVMFLRFLNSEVVNTRDAFCIAEVLIPKVHKNGIIICFGHTPVLISKSWFLSKGLKCLGSLGYDPNYNAIFQYYIFQVVN